ncbi:MULTISPECIES: thioredoxin [Anaerotruncus]|jgi:thioredoxin|uniref:Thioredoxin n=2 Tax=Anaerotruncus TaxID=244127 RepID=A0A498CNR0_9FIRM|nr:MULTISPECIES: thioredoxin [Anaerotruncus]MBC3939647.1 thioredoxin [Anaerotruncus massiliensis (ex Togo et al. 2019)]RLL08546.1 thioredoxin [Anaerotruncus massiliensis (ex Liu et al. 2021)]GKH47849.1 thiol reductase thioredoxin [Oscillospiraceae bacterium]
MSVVHFSKDTFDTEALGAAGPVLVDFWAPWCGPCKMLGPIIEQLGDEMDGKAVIGKVDIDEEPDLAARYGVMSIPTVILFKNGEEAARMVGLQSKQALVRMIEEA